MTAMTISDNERREVARKLREVNPYRNQSYTIPYHRYTPAAEYLAELAGALGYSPKNDVSRLEFQSKLADLIEPSCDRDALLALADEMQRELDECASDHEIAGNLQSQIDRIREALGASE